ncbi:ABC transporter permease [Telmatospirillum sp.]|uniref:ABC transporter permease n=1 Tax=Telmatospirillum sp. TaxID=2079197 RepID=UPI00283DB698|nr:ABC transporter permease [Telmatospirillum sp.]MDR3436997.1 ABC transporter permease [Telmatospirillum sp.]
MTGRTPSRNAPLFSWRRVYAIVLRHVYLMRGSWTRLAETIYWPLINVVVWGFITQFMAGHSDWVSRAAGVFLGAIMLWDVMFRSNLGVALSFLEEMWSRNLGHLSVSPLRPLELVTAMLLMSLIRLLVGMLPVALLTIPLYHYSIFTLGLPLLAFFINLMVSGWAVGLAVSAMVLRYGLGAESLAWVLIFAVAPLCGIYYPVSVLPDWLQTIAWWLPASHVFEGMRSVMFDQGFPLAELVAAAVLNLLYLTGAVLLFLRIYHVARVKGLFLGMGE